MILEDIAKYLEDNHIGTRETDIWGGELPLGKKDSIGIVYALSGDSNKAIDVYEQTLDFYSRFALTSPGYNKLLEIFNLLHKGQNYETDNYHIYFSNALGSIEDLDRDVERQKLFKLSVRFIFRRKS